MFAQRHDVSHLRSEPSSGICIWAHQEKTNTSYSCEVRMEEYANYTYWIENMMNESENNEAIVTEDGTVYRPADPLFHPYGIPKDCWLSCAVLIVVETPLLFVTMRVTTFGDKVTIGTAVS